MPAIVPKSLEQMRREHAALIAELVDSWFQQQCRNPWESLYLIGRRGRDSHDCEVWAALRIGPDPGEGETLVRSDRLSPSWSKDSARGALADWLRREPVFTFAD
jgi:hypothetical protein